MRADNTDTRLALSAAPPPKVVPAREAVPNRPPLRRRPVPPLKVEVAPEGRGSRLVGGRVSRGAVACKSPAKREWAMTRGVFAAAACSLPLAPATYRWCDPAMLAARYAGSEASKLACLARGWRGTPPAAAVRAPSVAGGSDRWLSSGLACAAAAGACGAGCWSRRGGLGGLAVSAPSTGRAAAVAVATARGGWAAPPAAPGAASCSLWASIQTRRCTPWPRRRAAPPVILRTRSLSRAPRPRYRPSHHSVRAKRAAHANAGAPQAGSGAGRIGGAAAARDREARAPGRGEQGQAMRGRQNGE